MQEAAKEDDAGTGTSYRLRIYAAVTVLLITVALLSFLVVPGGGGARSCTGYFLQNSRYACLTGLAVSGRNASVCANLPEQGTYSSDSCYSQVAQEEDNASVCGRIFNATEGYACTYAVALATGNYLLCGGIGAPYSGRCTDGIAVRLDMPSLCGGTGNATSAAECTSIVYVNRMLSHGDAGYCANVPGEENESVADYVISNVTYGLGSAFQNVSASFTSLSFAQNVTYGARDFCYYLAAEKLHDPSLCSDIAEGYVSSYCGSQFETAAVNATFNSTQLGAICSELGYGSQACQALTMAQAIATDNASECGTLQSLHDNCYSSLANAYNNTGFCQLISNASIKYACLNRT